MGSIVTKTWSTSDTLTAADLNQNFTDLEDYVVSLTNGDLAQDAGITADKLLDRNCPTNVCIPLLPFYGNSTNWTTAITAQTAINTGTVTTFASAVNIGRFRIAVPTGKRCFLTQVAFEPGTCGGSGNPRVWIAHNGTVLGGSTGADLVSNTANYLRNANPFTAPLLAVAHDDYFEFRIGSSTGTTATIIGLNVCLAFKWELVS